MCFLILQTHLQTQENLADVRNRTRGNGATWIGFEGNIRPSLKNNYSLPNTLYLKSKDKKKNQELKKKIGRGIK